MPIGPANPSANVERLNPASCAALVKTMSARVRPMPLSSRARAAPAPSHRFLDRTPRASIAKAGADHPRPGDFRKPTVPGDFSKNKEGGKALKRQKKSNFLLR